MAYGAILGQISQSNSSKVCRFVVGTSTSGWKNSDCDYLCDGTDDQVEINAAIQALPATGGEVVILDGTYNITASISMNKDNVKLFGNGATTVLKRMWNNSTFTEGVITVVANNGRCSIEQLCINGNKDIYTSNKNIGIYLNDSTNNTVTSNICDGNRYGIYFYGSGSNTVTSNICDGNYYGIYLESGYGTSVSKSDNNTVTGNICSNNGLYGIELKRSGNNTITGNTCNNNGLYGVYLLSSKNNTVTGNTCCKNKSGIFLDVSNNNVLTGNACNDNETGINSISSDNNAIIGNTFIRGSGGSSDYTSSQYTIYLKNTSNNYNLIACNNIMGKNYTSDGGTSNTFINNKYN